MLNLWWGLTEQTYLYYWHQNVWSVLVAWATVVLVIVLTVLVGAALWRAGTGRRFGPRDLSMHPLVRRSPAPLRFRQIRSPLRKSADSSLHPPRRFQVFEDSFLVIGAARINGLPGQMDAGRLPPFACGVCGTRRHGDTRPALLPSVESPTSEDTGVEPRMSEIYKDGRISHSRRAQCGAS
jgi:hypothetical protein